MTADGRRKIGQAGSLLLLFCFLGSAFLMIRNGRPAEWHARGFWEKQQWHEIRAVGENLYRLNKATPESLYLAMLASEELGRRADAELFAGRLMEQKFLNRRMEQEAARIYPGDTLIGKLRLHRTDAFLVLIVSAFLVQTAAIIRRAPHSALLALLSGSGILLCFI